LDIDKRIRKNKVDEGRNDMESYGIVGESEGIRRVIEEIKNIGRVPVTVVITGESGTGKELVARALHKESMESGRNERIICINCSAISENLVESELFGHVRGSFTGAANNRSGAVRSAEGGTLFLDEIGELPLSIQAKLLRMVENKEVSPVGSDETFKADIRIIAAASQDLKKMVAEGKFLEPLFYRLNILNIHMPPLRERQEDISLLTNHFFKIHCKEYGFNLSQIHKICVGIFAEEYGLNGKISGEEFILKAEDLLGSELFRRVCRTRNAGGIEDVIGNCFKLYYGAKNMTADFFKRMFVEHFSQKALKYDWPGNVRELSAAVLRSLVNGRIDIPSFSSFSRKTAREIKREKKEKNRAEAEKKKKRIKELMEEIVIGEYDGRISLAIKDSRLREAGIDTVPKLVKRLELVSLKEACRDARKKFFGDIPKEEIRDHMIKCDGNIRKLCGHYCISFREINEHFGEMLKKMKEEIKEGKKK